jgi:hypothetical protein
MIVPDEKKVTFTAEARRRRGDYEIAAFAFI